jgi:hypothetical protein
VNRHTRPFVASAGLAFGLMLAASSQASAQEGVPQPIGPFVVDVRGSIVPFGQNAAFAAPRGFSSSLTPALGLGVEAGAHAYLYRWRVITFGLGGSVHASLGDRSAGELDPDPDGPTLRKRFVALSSQLSFNFGSRDGWSYLSGGLGTSRYSLFALGHEDPQRRTSTINYGGGARWFTNNHLALSLDLRFYALAPLAATGTEPSSPRMTLMVFSVGASLK